MPSDAKFLVPNEPDATFADQAEPDSGDFKIITQGSMLEGVRSGCLVGPTSSGANMAVDVAAGVIALGGTNIATGFINLTISAADSFLPRFDLIVANSAGTVSVVTGTAATNAVFPLIPSNSVVLASVYVPVGTTSIDATRIVHKRILIRRISSLLPHG